MPKQDLNLIRAFAIIDGINGRTNTHQLRKLFVDAGCIPDGEEALLALQLHETLRIVHQHRKSKERRGEVQNQLVNLFEITDEGVVIKYFKRMRKTTVAEAAQHLQSIQKRIDEHQTKWNTAHDYYSKKYGDKLQRLLFDLTEPAAP